MSNEMIAALVALILGWILGQGTDAWKSWAAAQNLRRGMLVELEDIGQQLDLLAIAHARKLQIYSQRGIEPTTCLPIPHMFFEHYYQETYAHLNREQRLSFQLIHGLLDDLNRKLHEIDEFLANLTKRVSTTASATDVDDWGNRMKQIFTAAKTIRWHIDFHLQHHISPQFDFNGPMHRSYLEGQQKIALEIEEIITKAKSFDRKSFEKISPD